MEEENEITRDGWEQKSKDKMKNTGPIDGDSFERE